MKRHRQTSHTSPPHRNSGDRETRRVWRWKCEDAVSRYLTRFARHGGLASARAGMALLQNRLRILHGITPDRIKSVQEWQHCYDICCQESKKAERNLHFLAENPELVANAAALDGVQRRLARSFLAGQTKDIIDNAIDVGLHLPRADNDNHQRMDAMVIGDLVFWKQPALPEPPIRQSAWFVRD